MVEYAGGLGVMKLSNSVHLILPLYNNFTQDDMREMKESMGSLLMVVSTINVDNVH